MLRHPYRTTRRLSLQVLDDRRVLAAIVGSVFQDANESLRRDLAEGGLEKRLVYVDQNDNAQMDQGERYALTDSAGGFSIDNVSDGDYAIRLFSGARSQVQTTPSSATLLHDAVMRSDITAAVPAMVLDPGTPNQRTAPAILAFGASLQSVAADGTLSDPIDVGGPITHLRRLIDGSLAVFANTIDGGQAWIFDEALENSSALGSTGSDTLIVSAGGDDVGRSVIVTSSGDEVGQSELWTVDPTSMSASGTGFMVAQGSVVTSDETPRNTDGPTRSVISHVQQVDDGNGGVSQSLAISLWSHTGNAMLGDPILVSGASEVVAFSDQAGLLVLRTGDGLSVYDIDNSFATLYTIEDTAPVAAIDTVRGLLVILSPYSSGSEGAADDAGLRLIDSETGTVFADMPIDLSALGDVNAVSLDASLQTVFITGAAGLAQLTLRTPTAARVTVSGGQADPVEFGVQLLGENSAPIYIDAPVIDAIEDSELSGVLPLPIDIDGGDQLVILPLKPTQFGVATIGPDGQINYTPYENFEGVDTLSVLIGDGRDFTEATITIHVKPVPDPPTGVTASINPVPENLPPFGTAGGNEPIGIVGVIDVDAENSYGITILDRNYVPDERFQVIDLKIYYVGPEPLDAETEWLIPIIVSVDDHDSGTNRIFLTAISVLDEDDPITDITPDHATVPENAPGASITSLNVVDQDVGQTHALSVDDDRFEIVSGGLKLKDDVALDYEAGNTITVNVTAKYGDDSFTKAITLTVLDVAEAPLNLTLSNETVTELLAGAIVGELKVDGNPAADGHSLTVNDSRFVIDGSILRLVDGTFIERTPGVDNEILVEITATPLSGGIDGITEEFLIAVIRNSTPFHNDEYPEDVNHADGVTAVDALTIINYLNAYGPGPIGEGDPAFGYDVNKDGFVTSLDALLVINELNAISTSASGTVGNEPGGEPVPGRSGRKSASGSRDASRSNRITNNPVAPMQFLATRAAELFLSVPRDVALASLFNAASEKAAGSLTVYSLDDAVAVISIDLLRTRDDQTRADKVFGESEINLLG